MLPAYQQSHNAALFDSLSAPHTQRGRQVKSAWVAEDAGSVDSRQLSSAALHLTQGSVTPRMLFSTAESTTVAAQRCQLPPVPTCNSTAALEVWDEVLDSMDVDRALLLSCEVFAQVDDTAVVRYPPSEPSTGLESRNIGGVNIDEVCKTFFRTDPATNRHFRTEHDRRNNQWITTQNNPDIKDHANTEGHGR